MFFMFLALRWTFAGRSLDGRWTVAGRSLVLLDLDGVRALKLSMSYDFANQ